MNRTTQQFFYEKSRNSKINSINILKHEISRKRWTFLGISPKGKDAYFLTKNTVAQVCTPYLYETPRIHNTARMTNKKYIYTPRKTNCGFQDSRSIRSSKNKIPALA